MVKFDNFVRGCEKKMVESQFHAYQFGPLPSMYLGSTMNNDILPLRWNILDKWYFRQEILDKRNFSNMSKEFSAMSKKWLWTILVSVPDCEPQA